MNISEKFCPVCKHKNELDASVCGYCGASLEKLTKDGVATTRNADIEPEDSEKIEELLIDEALIPVGGIAVYIVGKGNPVFLCSDREFVIGRQMEETPETFLDLSNMGGYLLGLSRRHALVRRTGSGYEVIDLSSSNGTWLNGKRLLPRRPYPLTSGAQLRLGRMRLYVLYRTAPNNRQNT